MVLYEGQNFMVMARLDSKRVMGHTGVYVI